MSKPVTFASIVAIVGHDICDPDPASNGQLTLLILDGSGSMRRQIAGRVKIDIALDAIGQMLADWPEGCALGLMAYGQRPDVTGHRTARAIDASGSCAAGFMAQGAIVKGFGQMAILPVCVTVA